jgi:hypothetical protein
MEPDRRGEGGMPRKSFRPEEILAKLREAAVLLGQGKKVAEVVKALGVSEVKLRDELLDREVFHALCARRRSCSVQGEALDGRRHHNAIRPPSALGYRPPAPETLARPAWPPSWLTTGHGADAVYH